MQNLLKITFILSMAAILVWLGRPVLFWLFSLEFANSDIALKYKLSWRYILPIALGLSISGEYLNGTKPQSLSGSIFARLILSALVISWIYISPFMDMCSWTTQTVYYTSTKHAGQIALMEYGCGAYDSDSNPNQAIRLVKPVNHLLNIAYTCDTTSIDQSEWQRVK